MNDIENNSVFAEQDEKKVSGEDKKPANSGQDRKTLRLALIASEETVYAYSQLLRHLLVGLVDESIPVVLICPNESKLDGIVPPMVEIIRYPVYELPFMGHHNKKILSDQLTKFEPTLIHCLCESQSQLARSISKRLGLPYVLTVNSLADRRREFSISSRRLAKIIVPAASIAANLKKLHTHLADRIEQINMGSFTGEKVCCFANESEVASIVVSHRLDYASDFEKLIGAVKHLAIEGHEFMLVFTGDGKAERQVRKRLSCEGLMQQTTILPALSNWPAAIGSCDIFVQPVPIGHFDPFLLEAISAGLAIVGCKGGVDDLIIDGETAVVFDPGDELSIYNSLGELLNARDKARQFAECGQNYLRENHSVSKMVESILGIYNSAEHWLKR